jgi:hypothetical protein
MKTLVKKRSLIRSNDFKEKVFSIKTNNKAFRILSDGLYSDKIKAVIRELSCNAYDAHADASNLDETFDVHLPTKLDPTFYIRDYGIGLSKEDVETIYTTYFESTKTNSNNTVGCLGLGSKSPFCYVDMYVVTSYFDGEEYVYTALLNEEGIPTISLINEKETIEHNGLKVQFSVKSADISNFAFKAQDYYKYSKMLPNFVGNKVEIKRIDYVVKNDRWGIRKGFSSRANAIMGNVSYPVSVNSPDMSDLEMSMVSSYSIDMFFEIGDLEVSASREELSYDGRTIDCIRSRIEEIVEHETDRINKEIEEQECYWDAVNWIEKQIRENVVVKSIYNGKIRPSYKGRPISGRVDIDPEEYEKFGIVISSSIANQTYRNEMPTLSNPEPKASYGIRPEVSFFLVDASDYKRRAKEHIVKKQSEHTIESVIWIKTNKREDLSQCALDKLKNDFGITEAHIVKLSSIDIPKRVVRKREAKDNSHYKSFKFIWGKTHQSANCYWENSEITVSIEDGGFYVPMSRWRPIYQGVDRDNDFINIKGLLNGGIDNENNPVIHGVKLADEKRFKTYPNWVNWFDHCDRELKSGVSKRKELVSALKLIYLTRHNGMELNRFYDIVCMKGPSNIDCKCPKIRKLIDIFLKTKEQIEYEITYNFEKSECGFKFKLLSHCLSGKFLTKKQIASIKLYPDEYNELIKEIKVLYPFLDTVSSSYCPSKYLEVKGENVFNYINAMHKFNKQKRKLK